MTEIRWREWSDKAFAEARRQNKPVLLDIMATWCHWCHVMESTSYADDEAAEIVNRDYIAVRVDTDRRPDINARYNMGGWPTTAFLTPDGDVLTGGTYIPAERFRETLRRVSKSYQRGGEMIAQSAASIRADRATSAASASGGSSLTDRIVNDVVWAIRSEYDDEFPGIGAQPKFPQPNAVELLLNQYHRTQETDLRDMALAILDAMMSGGTWDSAAGGFFRYATMRDWSVPHYEKLLTDQAGALRNYIQAYQATARKEYLQTARHVLEFVESSLTDPETGAFFGSQTADEEYYGLPPKERRGLPAPPVDRTVFADWNAEMSFACLKAYEATLNEEYLKTAQRNARFIMTRMRGPSGGIHHYFDGKARAYGMLSDQAAVLRLLCEMYQCSGDRRDIEDARELAAFVKAEFADSLGGFLDVTVDRAKEERLPFRDKPLELNGLVSRGLIHFAALTGARDYRLLAESGLRALTGRYRQHGYMAAGYAIAVSEALDEPVEVAIVGDHTDERVKELRESALKSYEPYKIVLSFDPAADAERLRRKGYPVPKQPKAFVCVARTCQPPTGEPQAVEEAVARAGGHGEDA